jgi:hypothetical protein
MSESVGDKRTLKYFRKKYDRRNATPKKVLDCYEGSEELFLSVGRAYIIVAVLHFFGMSSVDDKPTIHEFPKYIIHGTDEQKKIILMKSSESLYKCMYCKLIHLLIMMSMMTT